MPRGLEIKFSPEALADGLPEERAAFGLFTIQTDNGLLTEGWDSFLDGSRAGPMVSAYYVAEWFAWHWWRQRWEPRRNSLEWDMAHQMSSIGEGYLWPNVTIFSDGERTALLSSASENQDAKPFRFFGANPVVLPSTIFESAVDTFVGQVLARLQTQGVAESNLSHIWADVLAERGDPGAARRRKIEAMLGREPDDIEDGQVERLISDTERLGEQAVEEVAADQERLGDAGLNLMSARELQRIAAEKGFDALPADAVRLHDFILPQRSEVPAWKRGAIAARRLREQENLGSGKINNARLAALAGTERNAVARDRSADQPMSYSLRQTARRSKLVLRSKWEGGRRFDLARLIGDNLMHQGGNLHPATRALTYRQKAQRSFAAELLSPFEAVDDMLEGDYSLEAQQDVAEYFSVSPMTINTLLKNHGRIERDDPEYYALA